MRLLSVYTHAAFGIIPHTVGFLLAYCGCCNCLWLNGLQHNHTISSLSQMHSLAPRDNWALFGGLMFLVCIFRYGKQSRVYVSVFFLSLCPSLLHLLSFNGITRIKLFIVGARISRDIVVNRVSKRNICGRHRRHRHRRYRHRRRCRLWASSILSVFMRMPPIHVRTQSNSQRHNMGTV